MTSTKKLNLADMDWSDAQRRALPKANCLLMTDAKLDELLNPVHFHVSGKGKRRAAQLRNAYNHFRETTVDQIVGSASVPNEHMATFERDLVQRAEQVNKSFQLLACYTLAELTNPTEPEPPVMVRAGLRVNPELNFHFGSETAVGLAKYTVEEMNKKANHFWNSVMRRIDANDNRWNNATHNNESADQDEDLY